ncbi:uncharacterized protein ACRADG_002826 [Cochliomyia hominivorax]
MIQHLLWIRKEYVYKRESNFKRQLQSPICFSSEMKLNLKLISIIGIFLLGFVCASQAGTFKPFVRSRYSLRWRKTTETPKAWDSSTTSAIKEDVERSSIKTLEGSGELKDHSIQLTTVKTLFKTSTHSSDYDYYNNEVDEGDHKN